MGRYRAGAGTALYVACDAGFRTTFGLGGIAPRVAAAGAALVTIGLGTALGGTAQVAALAVIVIAASLVGDRTGGSPRTGEDERSSHPA